MLGILSSIAVFMAVIAFFFLYLSNKLSVENTNEFSCFDEYRKDLKGKYMAIRTWQLT